MNKTYQLETLTCPSCVMKIEGTLRKTKGVKEVQVLFNASKVKANFDEEVIGGDQIRKIIENLGFDVLGEK